MFKHSFLSMRRIDAKSRKARAVLVRFSKSLASRGIFRARRMFSPRPTVWYDLEANRGVGSFDDFSFQVGQDFLPRVVEYRPLVSAVGKEFLQKRKPAEQGSEDQNAAIAVLDIGWMHDGVQQQAYRVDKDVALLTFDLLTRIVARRIDAGPPFSAPFTL